MGDDDDTRALEFFSRIEDAIITNNFEEDKINKSNGQIGTILTVTATSNSSISSSSNINQFEEEEEDSFSLPCDNNNRIDNMIVGKEDSDSIGDTSNNYTDKEDGTLGDMDVPLIVTDTSGKASINGGNTDQSIDTVTVGTYDTAGITTNKQRTKDDDNDDDEDDGVEGNSDDASSRISESTTSRMKFQPLQPLPGKILESVDTDCSTIQNHAYDSCSKKSSSISINNPLVKEGGLKFMNNIQDPVAASRGVLKNTCGGELEDEILTTITASSASASTQQQQVSHTPPTNMSTSYETMHFGKRPRSGSLSERLLVSTELEEKGIINRDQKGILKDLIISGQDNEIQHALDRYEQGDATMLESMLTSGILSTKATEEIDLLGQLDFDFLNVKEQQEQEQRNGSSNSNNNSTTSISQTTRTGSIASDGIGDLEFDGGVGNWEQGENSDNNRSRSNSTWSALENRTRANSTLSNLEFALQQQQHRSRANSAMSIDLDNFRPRSNSLFSPLIGNQTPEVQANFGRWMETSSASGTAGSSEAQQKPTEQQQKLLQQQLHHEHHFQQLLNEQKKEKKEKQKSKPKSKSKITKPIRRKAAPGGGGRVSKPPSAATIAKEQLREEKRKVRLLKKVQKEKEKQEKKETKERVKREKQKKKEDTDQHEKEKEKEVHMPGSGRPRSMSDPSLNSRVREDGLLEVVRPDGWIGAYSPESRKVRIGRFMEKRNHRVWTKTVKYDVRKNFADSRLRVKGRFVKKDDELLMRELMSLT